METTSPLSYPPLLKRCQSLIVDQMFIILCMVILSKVFDTTDEDGAGALRGVLFFSLFLIYEPFCIAFACTIGNYVTGIRVRRFDDNARRISLFNSYIRLVVKYIFGIVSFFTVTSDKWKRAIHDRAADSVMIYEKDIQEAIS